MKETTIKIVEDSGEIDWEPWVLSVAVLTLIASVIIPFAQKKYEEFRTKRNFQYYLKKQTGLVLNLLIEANLEYHDPSVKNEPKKDILSVENFVSKLKSDFTEHKNSIQPRVIFMLLMNVQNLCQFTYQLRQVILTIDLQNITEKTLEHGKELSRIELNKIYGLILIYETFIPLSIYHDKFGEIISIKRTIEDGIWKGLTVEKDLLKNQNRLNDDLLILNDNERSLQELTNGLLLVNQETKKYFDWDELQAKRKKAAAKS